MKKLRLIIKDIVKQQIEFANQTNQIENEEFVRQMTYKQLVITKDEVGQC